MKTLILALILSSTTAFASIHDCETDPTMEGCPGAGTSVVIAPILSCLDIRATTFSPCKVGQTRRYVQGACGKTYQAESTYCAEKGKPDCIDRRAAYFTPCKGRQSLIFVQGQCERSFEVEHTYCAER